MWMKRCSISLAISEMQIKTIMRYHFIPSRTAIFKKRQIISISENVEKVGPSNNVSGNVKWYNHFGKVWQFLKWLNMELPYDQLHIYTGYCCCSVTQSCPTLCDPMDCSTPGFPVLHHLPEFSQTHVHWVSDAIQPSHPLSSPSPPAFNLFQHQGLF